MYTPCSLSKLVESTKSIAHSVEDSQSKNMASTSDIVSYISVYSVRQVNIFITTTRGSTEALQTLQEFPSRIIKETFLEIMFIMASL
jgi:hypothetical protein